MNPIAEFEEQVERNVELAGRDIALQRQSLDWMIKAGGKYKYSYNFSWLGRPIIQYPQDIQAVQEIIWAVRPDLVIETGIAHGGSLILSASMLALLDMCDAAEKGVSLNPRASNRKVLGIDIDIRAHNKKAIEDHPMSCRIQMIQGSSVDSDVVRRVHEIAKGYSRVLVLLDSNHTHDHVLAELRAYGPLVTVGSYCVVFDTVIEDVPSEFNSNRPWGCGNSPKTAVKEFLAGTNDFVIDKRIQNKLQITVALDGYLRRVS